MPMKEYYEMHQHYISDFISKEYGDSIYRYTSATGEIVTCDLLSAIKNADRKEVKEFFKIKNDYRIIKSFRKLNKISLLNHEKDELMSNFIEIDTKNINVHDLCDKEIKEIIDKIESEMDNLPIHKEVEENTFSNYFKNRKQATIEYLKRLNKNGETILLVSTIPSGILSILKYDINYKYFYGALCENNSFILCVMNEHMGAEYAIGAFKDGNICFFSRSVNLNRFIPKIAEIVSGISDKKYMQCNVDCPDKGRGYQVFGISSVGDFKISINKFQPKYKENKVPDFDKIENMELIN